MQKVTPCLWFDGQAEEAANFYVSIFKNSKTGQILRWGKEAPEKQGRVLLVTFELDGQTYQALNGGPEFHFTEAISLSIDCKDQQEVDYFWEKLTADGGKEVQCSWLKDKFGVSWQVVPEILPRLLNDPDKDKAARVMLAMMDMVKIDVAKLEAAARG